MLRIYLDKQIISNLQKAPIGQEALFAELHDILINNKNDFFLFYSIGHLSDFSRDLSYHRDLDLEFMEKLGFRHFIHYTPNFRATYIRDEKPIIIFKTGKFKKPTYSELKSSESFKDFNAMTDVMYKRYYQLLLKVEKKGIDSLSQGDKWAFSLMRKDMPFDSKSITKRKFVKYHKNRLRKITDGDKKKLRAYVNNMISHTKQSKTAKLAPINELRKLETDKPNLNEVLRNSLTQTYLVERLIDISKLTENNRFESLFTERSIPFLYANFEITGLVNEKPGDLNFNNMISDGEHCSFASFCDILITEDKKLSLKSKILYGSLGINTLVFTTQQFLSFFKDYNSSLLIDKDEIINFSQAEVYRHLISEKEQFGYIQETSNFNSQWRYLEFFNCIQYDSFDALYSITFLRLTNNFINLWTVREIKALVEICINTFGLDQDRRNYFDMSTEQELFVKHIWPGRKWKVSHYVIELIANVNNANHVIVRIGPFVKNLS